MVSLDYLRAFVEFAKSENMSLAAQKLGISQPAVSKQLQVLEESFEKPLFLTDGTKKILSPWGRQLFETSSPLVQELSEKIQSFAKTNAALQVRIAGQESILESLIKKMKTFPSAFEMLPCTSAQATQKIREQNADLAVSYDVPHSGDLIAKRLFESRAVLVFSASHLPSLAKKTYASLSSKDLTDHPFVCYRKDDVALVQLFKKKDVPFSNLKCALVAPNWSILKEAALQGIGVAVIPSEQLQNEGLSRIEFDDQSPIRFQYHLIYAKSFSKIPLGQKWIAALLTARPELSTHRVPKC